MDFKNIILRGNRRLSHTDCELLYKTASEIKAKTLFEIGSADGTSSIILGTIAKENNGNLYCIEPKPTARFKGNLEQLELQNNVQLITIYSPYIDINLIPNEIDFLFIDGDHHTKQVVLDYLYWEKFVRIGGRIAFHDIANVGTYANQVSNAINFIYSFDKNRFKEIAKDTTPPMGILIIERVK